MSDPKTNTAGAPTTPQPNVATRRSSRLLRSSTKTEESTTTTEIKKETPAKVNGTSTTNNKANNNNNASKRENNSKRKSTTPIPTEPAIERPYNLIDGIPMTKEDPNYSKLTNGLSIRDSHALLHSLDHSRNSWLSGEMFEKFWTRPPRGRKLATGEVNAREKMTKLCECTLALGPHFFDVKLFVVKDDSEDEKDEPDLRRIKPPVAATPKASAKNSTMSASKQPSNSTTEASSTPSTTTQEPKAESTNNAENSESKKDITDSTNTKDEDETKEDKPLPDASTDTPESKADTQKEQVKESTTNTSDVASSSKAPADSQPPSATAELPIPSNQMMITKLQTIARTDPSLTPLMKVVATGKATNEQIARFQVYISKARAMELAANRSAKAKQQKQQKQQQKQKQQQELQQQKQQQPQQQQSKPAAPRPPAKPKAPKTPVQKAPKVPKPKPPPKSTYTPKKNMKNVMVVFEFKDNPADRYILPREAIVEVLPNDAILMSFLMIHNKDWKGEQPKKKLKKEEEEEQTKKDKQTTQGEGEAKEKALGEDSQGSSMTEKNSETDNGNNKDDGAEKATETPVTEANNGTQEGAEKAESTPVKEEPFIPKEPPIFTAATISIINVPKKSIPVIERSVTKQEITQERIKQVMELGIRSEDYKVWHQIEKEDIGLLEDLKKPAKLPANFVAPARKREYKPRKKNEDGTAPKRQKKKQTEDETKSTADTSTSKPEDTSTTEQKDETTTNEKADGSEKDLTASTEAGDIKPDDEKPKITNDTEETLPPSDKDMKTDAVEPDPKQEDGFSANDSQQNPPEEGEQIAVTDNNYPPPDTATEEDTVMGNTE